MSGKAGRYPSRRGVLAAAGATAVTTAAVADASTADRGKPADAATSAAAPEPSAGAPLVDVHSHAMPPAVRAWLVAHGKLPPVGGPPFAQWDSTTALATMDANNIQMAVLSAAIPSAFVDNVGQAAELARLANTSIAEAAAGHPDRFGLFAYLPLPYVDQAITELDYALDTLHADGVILMSHGGATYLGDPSYEPLMAALNDRSAVVLTHPFDLPNCTTTPIPAFLVDFLADTGRAAILLAVNGVLDRYPNIHWVLPHGGGLLPYMAARLSLGASLGYGLDGAATAKVLRRFYYDTAGPMSPYATPSLLTAAGVERILFGSDYNAIPADEVAAAVAAFNADPALRPADRSAISRANALRLLPAVAARLRRERTRR